MLPLMSAGDAGRRGGSEKQVEEFRLIRKRRGPQRCQRCSAQVGVTVQRNEPAGKIGAAHLMGGQETTDPVALLEHAAQQSRAPVRRGLSNPLPEQAVIEQTPGQRSCNRATHP